MSSCQEVESNLETIECIVADFSSSPSLFLEGLEDAVLPYVQFFLNNNVDGCRLLLLTTDDLDHLNVKKIGHQEIILEGVDLLKHLHYSFASETLQSQALRLGCRARSLFNQLKCDEDRNLNQDRVSTTTLSSVSDILFSVKSFISWIDRYPFSAQDTYLPVRESILRRSIELASTAQRDQFVEKPNEVLKHTCAPLATLCDKIVQDLNDSLAITPASLEGNFLFWCLFWCLEGGEEGEGECLSFDPSRNAFPFSLLSLFLISCDTK